MAAVHHLPPLLLLLLLLLLSSLAFAAQQDPAAASTETQALLALKSAFHSSTALLPSWSNSSSPCDPKAPWQGVLCFRGAVASLRLGNLGLSGAVDVNALSHLRGLRSVSLLNNSFSGPLPDFSKLRALRSIFLSNNAFSGNVSADLFSGLAHLRKLWLSDNALGGAIPPSISKLVLLRELHLENNKFVGGMPEAQLPTLISFNVSNNQLQGSIPAGFLKFGVKSFLGNSGLCGPPLDKPCSATSTTSAAGTATTEANSSDAAASAGKGAAANAPLPPVMTNDINSGKKAVVCMVLIVLVLALVGGLLVTKKKGGNGFNTLESEYDEEVHVPSSELSSHKQQGSTRMRRQESSSKKGSVKAGSVSELVIVNEGKGMFGLPDLMKAAAEVLGNGGIGSAYKAVMANGMTVVVKRMKEMNRLGREGFDGEMKKIGGIRHPNVLSPLAYHYRKEEKLFVFDYIDKGSLLYILHGDRGPDHAALNWPTRLKIIRGIAKGMAHLHEQMAGAEVPHGNLKSGNVLLDGDFEPVIIDYGYTPLVNPQQAAQVMFAYRSPEYAAHQHLSPKSDVYCLGIIILEVLSGKFPSQYLSGGKGGTDVVEWANSAIAEEREVDLIDPEIVVASKSKVGVMERLVRVGASLTEPDPSKRPDMKEASRRIDEIEMEAPAPPSHAELTARRSGREAVGDRSSRHGDGGFDFSIS